MTSRFKVTSITGYAIGERGGRKQLTNWYVLDRAYNHRIVHEFKGRDAEQRAHQYAHTLEHNPNARPPTTALSRPLDPITSYLGYPIVAKAGGFFIHEHKVGTVSAARAYIKKLRREKRAA